MDFCTHVSEFKLSSIKNETNEPCTSLSETVRVLDGEREIKAIQAQLQQTHNSKMDLLKQHTELQRQYKGIKGTVASLTSSCEAAEGKILLQTQLHADRLRKIEITHDVLKDRCKAMAISAEQGRIDKLRSEEMQKSMAKDIQHLAEHQSAEKLVLQSTILAKEGDISALNCKLNDALERVKAHQIDALQSETEISSLKSKIDAHGAESRLLQEKVDAVQQLLKSHPVNLSLNLKTKNIIQSSAEILELHNGGIEGICLVGKILKDLNKQLESHGRLCSAWLDQV